MENPKIASAQNNMKMTRDQEKQFIVSMRKHVSHISFHRTNKSAVSKPKQIFHNKNIYNAAHTFCT